MSNRRRVDRDKLPVPKGWEHYAGLWYPPGHEMRVGGEDDEERIDARWKLIDTESAVAS